MNPHFHTDSAQPLWRQVLVLGAAATLLIGGGTVAALWRFGVIAPAPPPMAITPSQPKTVTALGRLEPRGKVIKLSAPVSSEGSRVEQLLVDEGSSVQPGQVIAILDNRDRLQAALLQAEQQVRVAEANLAKVRAGAKAGEIAAQEATIARVAAEREGDLSTQTATIARLEAELQNAELEHQRYQSLYSEGAISASQRDSRQLTLRTAQERLQEARAGLNRTRTTAVERLSEAQATLDRISEVRPVDIEAAEAEVSSAVAAVKRAEANLKQAYVRAPRAGQVLKVNTRPGELIASEGIAELGQTSQMDVVAEVYESDIHQVKVGQVVRVTSDAVPGLQLKGRVEQLGLRIQRQNVVNTDPSSNVDSRVVEVRIQLDPESSQKVAGFTNLQVKAVISL